MLCSLSHSFFSNLIKCGSCSITCLPLSIIKWLQILINGICFNVMMIPLVCFVKRKNNCTHILIQVGLLANLVFPLKPLQILLFSSQSSLRSLLLLYCSSVCLRCDKINVLGFHHLFTKGNMVQVMKNCVSISLCFMFYVHCPQDWSLEVFFVTRKILKNILCLPIWSFLKWKKISSKAYANFKKNYFSLVWFLWSLFF